MKPLGSPASILLAVLVDAIAGDIRAMFQNDTWHYELIAGNKLMMSDDLTNAYHVLSSAFDFTAIGFHFTVSTAAGKFYAHALGVAPDRRYELADPDFIAQARQFVQEQYQLIEPQLTVIANRAKPQEVAERF